MSRPRKLKWQRVWVPVSHTSTMTGANTITVVAGKTRARMRGLAITPGMGFDVGMHVITHVASGLKVPSATFQTVDAARPVAELIATLHDWTLPGDSVKKDRDLAIAVYAILDGAR